MLFLIIGKGLLVIISSESIILKSSSKYFNCSTILPSGFTTNDPPSKISSVCAPTWFTKIMGVLNFFAWLVKIFRFVSIPEYVKGEAAMLIIKSGFCKLNFFIGDIL